MPLNTWYDFLNTLGYFVKKGLEPREGLRGINRRLRVLREEGREGERKKKEARRNGGGRERQRETETETERETQGESEREHENERMVAWTRTAIVEMKRCRLARHGMSDADLSEL